MEYITKVLDLWQIKLVPAFLIVFFSPFKVSLFILIILILTDTITACFNAVRFRKFSSRRFQKGAKKVVTYFTTIVVVRLLEVGIAPIIQTTTITSLIAGFLIFTEVISILENLTLLGVPLPPEVLRIILGSMNFQKFNELFGRGLDKQKYMAEIDEIIQYQIPAVKCEDLQKLLTIKFEEWKNTISVIDMQLSNNSTEDNDLLFYRISSLITMTNNAVNDKWLKEGIPQKRIDAFNQYHQKRVDDWISDIKEICYSSDNIDKKRKAIIEKTMIILYSTVIDAQKGEKLCL